MTPPAQVTVRPQPATCPIPDPPAPIKLGATPVTGGLMVTGDAMRALGNYLLAEQQLVQALRDCLAARGSVDAASPAP